MSTAGAAECRHTAVQRPRFGPPQSKGLHELLVCPQMKTWKVSPDLFPVELSSATQSAATAAVEAAVAMWGERAISELEAEDRLAFACEKAPTEDPVTAQVCLPFCVRRLRRLANQIVAVL